MARTGEESSGRKSGKAKYTRYTDEQTAALERIYATCSNPNRFQRAQIMRDEPALKHINNQHLKVWFQNRRCRERQRKGGDELVTECNKLGSLNKLLREENDCLHKKVAQLQCENEHLRNQSITCTSTITTIGLDHVREANPPQVPSRTVGNYTGILALAEETVTKFLSKAIGNSTINWIYIPVSKLPGDPSSVTAVYISNTCIGVAARAYAVVPFEPIKTIELLKDRLSWSRDCRNVEVHAKYPANNGGFIELIYSQYYATTTLACARDFWTLRFTSITDDGSFVVCEKSVSGSDAVPSSPAALEFVRARMMASGYMVRPCEGGSTVHLVDHIDLEACSVPDIIRPLYQSSELIAKKMTVSALRYIEQVAVEENYNITDTFHETPAVRRSFAQRLNRHFNDAINGSTEDGWTLMNSDDDFIISVKRDVKGVNSNYDGVICIKASLLLDNVSPATLIRFLKENRPAWMGFDFSDHYAALSRVAGFVFPRLYIHNLSKKSVLLGETGYEDEVVEIIRFDFLDNNSLHSSPEDLYHLQISNGLEETNFGACSEFIFAPINRSMPNGSALLSSGFRVMSLGSDKADLIPSRSILILAFQFPFEGHRQDEMVVMAKMYVQHVVSTITNNFPPVSSTGSSPETEVLDISQESIYGNTLTSLIFQSYRSTLGMNMFGFSCQSADSLHEEMENHSYAILCFSIISPAECLYANHSAVNMLQMATGDLESVTIDKILDGSNNMSLESLVPTLIQQGYAILPPGYSMSEMNQCVRYEQGVAWLVFDSDGSVQSIALAFNNWSFV